MHVRAAHCYDSTFADQQIMDANKIQWLYDKCYITYGQRGFKKATFYNFFQSMHTNAKPVTTMDAADYSFLVIKQTAQCFRETISCYIRHGTR